ncbi:MAG: O-antigen ligase family protein [Longimicrobiales bacterium]
MRAMTQAIRHRSQNAIAPAAGVSDGYWDRTHWVVIAMIGVLAVRIHELVPVTGYLRPALLVSFGGLFLVLRRTDHALIKPALDTPLAKLVLGFFIWCALTIPTALWKAQALESLQALLPAILMFVTILLCRPDARVLDRIMVGWVAALGIFTAMGQVMGVVNRGRLRFGGMYDSNDIAALLAMGFPIALGLALRTRGRDRTIAIIGTLLIVATLVATGSRGGAVGFLAGAAAFAFASRGSRKAIVMVILACVVAGAWVMSEQTFRNRMISLTNLEYDYNTTSEVGRKAIWTRGWQYTLQRPVFGVGMGNFPMAEGDWFTVQDRRNKWSTAHNSYIQASSETGFPGALIFIAMLLTAFGVAWRVRSRGIVDGRRIIHTPELVGALAAYAVTAYFLSHAYFNPVYALLAIIAFASRVQNTSFAVPAPQRSHVVAAPPEIAGRSGERGGLVYSRSRLGPPQTIR